ncbi:MAG: LysR family transcriptional regulator [Planctomycetaceae bacterium]
MHLRFVEIFCDVAQRRSFSKGAQAHRVSQSSASQAVHYLEQRLGTKLIDRSKRPLELTLAGRVYYEGCRDLLERFRAVEDHVRSLHDQVAGGVCVAAIYSVGLMQMEQFVQRFESQYPQVRLRLEYLHPDAVYQQVLDDRADLGLVSFPRHGGEIVSLDWQEQPMVLVVPPGHRLAARAEIPLAELAGEDYVGFTQDLTIHREVDRWLRRARIAVNVVHEFDNIETIKRAIEIGSGVALLPEPTVWQELSNGTLAAIPLADCDLRRPLGIVHRRGRKLTTAAKKFVELLRETAPPGATAGARRARRRRAKRRAEVVSGAGSNGSRRSQRTRV